MSSINFVKRCGNSKAKVTVINFDVLEKQFISDFQVISEIPAQLLLN